MKTLLFGMALLCRLAMASPCADAVRDSRSLIAQDGWGASVRLLQPLEDQCAGNPDFDYLLGVSLLNSGDPESASWVLERVTAENPRYGAAWLDLADALIRLDEDQRATEALQHAILLGPPPAARQKIQTLQGVLQERQTHWHASAFTAVELGSDSNVNSATDMTIITVPALGGINFALDRASTRQSSLYRDWEVGGALDWQASRDTQWYVQPDLKIRNYLSVPQYNRDIASLQGGVGTMMAGGELVSSLQIEQQRLGGNPYLLTQGATLEWRARLNAEGLMKLTGQYQTEKYQDPHFNSNDVNIFSAGGSLDERFNQGRGQWTLAVYRQEEVPDRSRPSGCMQGLLLYAGLNYTFIPALSAHVSLSHQADKYQYLDPAFLQVRTESVWSYSLGLTENFAHDYSLDESYTRMHDDADIGVYGYSRSIFSVSLRREW